MTFFQKLYRACYISLAGRGKKCETLPLKGRESGMPECDRWESFFDAEKVVELFGCTDMPGDIVEFGCGFGTFTLPVARRTTGVVHALDIDPE